MKAIQRLWLGLVSPSCLGMAMIRPAWSQAANMQQVTCSELLNLVFSESDEDLDIFVPIMF